MVGGCISAVKADGKEDLLEVRPAHLSGPKNIAQLLLVAERLGVAHIVRAGSGRRVTQGSKPVSGRVSIVVLNPSDLYLLLGDAKWGEHRVSNSIILVSNNRLAGRHSAGCAPHAGVRRSQRPIGEDQRGMIYS